MKFRPLHDRVVVKRIDAEEKTSGGIIIPDTAKEKPSQGEIVAVGPGGRDEAGKLIPIDLKVGDRVLFGKWSGTEVKIDGVELLIMKESDIMGVLDEPAARKRRPRNHQVDPRPEERRKRPSRRARAERSFGPHPSRRGLRSLLRMRLTERRKFTNGCQGSQIRRRRARPHAARRRHSRQRGESDARPQGPQRRARQVVRRSPHHQGRRHRRQGDRARGQVREHGRADGA